MRKIESGWTIAKVLVSTVIFKLKFTSLFPPNVGEPSSATGGTCTKTERKIDQQQYSSKYSVPTAL